MTQLTDSGIYAVEVPDQSKWHQIVHISAGLEVLQYYIPKDQLERSFGINLPEGYWQYLFTTKGATEEQAASVVQLISNGKITGRPQYRRYDRDLTKDMPAKCWTRDPRHSLETLLTAKGCDTANNHALMQKQV